MNQNFISAMGVSSTKQPQYLSVHKRRNITSEASLEWNGQFAIQTRHIISADGGRLQFYEVWAARMRNMISTVETHQCNWRYG